MGQKIFYIFNLRILSVLSSREFCTLCANDTFIARDFFRHVLRLGGSEGRSRVKNFKSKKHSSTYGSCDCSYTYQVPTTYSALSYTFKMISEYFAQETFSPRMSQSTWIFRQELY